MTTLLVCLFIMVLVPYLARIPVAIAMAKLGGYNNNLPREQQAKLSGFGARALGAHQNSFEALLVFAIAILTAVVTHNDSSLIQNLAIAYVISRVVYHACYLMNLATIRSLVWFVGYICCLVIMWQSIF